MHLIPPGYVMWQPDGEFVKANVYSYPLSRETICQIRIIDEWVKYRIINAYETADVDYGIHPDLISSSAVEHDRLRWRSLLTFPGHSPKPVVCFGCYGGPCFVIRDFYGIYHMIIIGDGYGAGMYTYTMGHEIMTYDPMSQKIYLYENSRLYMNTTTNFI